MDKLSTEYLKRIVDEIVEDIVKHDHGELIEENLKYLDMAIIIMCDRFKLISHDQAVELREAVVRELEKLEQSCKCSNGNYQHSID